MRWFQIVKIGVKILKKVDIRNFFKAIKIRDFEKR